MRALKNWLTAYLEYTENEEPPEKFHFWTGMSVVSTALQRRVYLEKPMYKLFPNLYIVLVSESGQVRKSAALDVGVRLLQESIPGICVVQDSVTPEGLVDRLNRSVIGNDDKGVPRTIRQESNVLIWADELANLFSYDKQRASRMTILLTRMFNSSESYEHTTKGEGITELYNLYPNLLAATDPRNLKVLPEDAIGGLLGRTIFVSASKRRKRPSWYPRDIKLYDMLRADLLRISALEGCIEIGQKARDHWEEWYQQLADREYEDTRVRVFQARAHDLALKLSMLFSVIESNSLVVEPQHVQAGIEVVEKQLPEYTQISTWAVDTVFAQNKAKFLDIIRRKGGTCNRKQILKGLGISVNDVEVLVEALKQEGVLTALRVRMEWIYRLTPEAMLEGDK